MVRLRRFHHGLVDNAEDLAAGSQPLQKGRHRAAHPRIDPIKEQGVLRISTGQTGFQRER